MCGKLAHVLEQHVWVCSRRLKSRQITQKQQIASHGLRKNIKQNEQGNAECKTLLPNKKGRDDVVRRTGRAGVRVGTMQRRRHAGYR
ncbi:hypothetical protein CSA80_03265 [Candidatus Saccharibacteria bacterium]|nr:MAG: hypothetical protein CSA80_03265 [Candidatus Saccharibacteria bacterium]